MKEAASSAIVAVIPAMQREPRGPRAVLATNVTGDFMTARRVLPHLRRLFNYGTARCERLSESKAAIASRGDDLGPSQRRIRVN
jgi:NAD(P)-dependent dehydrogenase (short-subunit alcohol dehydrogenase family)